MADEADRTDDHVQATVEHGIAQVRARIGRGLLPIGVCHWCESPVHGHLLFCPDDSCDADWQHNHDRKQAQGE